MVICCYYYSYNTNSHNIAQASCKLTVLPKFSRAEITGLNHTEGSGLFCCCTSTAKTVWTWFKFTACKQTKTTAARCGGAHL